ncbi:MAG: HlyD family efflux transporter periplasmic adaptor subunit [Verrucomicrobia bacterium]|nr:HlyD family efflux transporter periplasmic adaptor subunit [Verrucomicrobiota bacterium]
MWRHPRLVWRRILKGWPLLLWIGAVVLVMFFYRGSGQLASLQGAAETVTEPVAPLETARLLTLSVTTGQRVKAGDTLATMDTLLFDAETAVDEAQLIEVEGTLQNYQQRILQFVREFQDAKNQAQFELEMQILNQKRDKSVLAVLQAELQRLEDLKSKGLVSEQELARLRPEIAALEQTVAAYPELIKIHARRLQGATADEVAMRQLISEGEDDQFDILSTLRNLRKAADAIIESSHSQREILRASYVLRAQRDGIVSDIFHQPGDVVSAGIAVLSLVAEHPVRVIGFLPEIHLGDVATGDSVTIWRQHSGAKPIPGVVDSISPDISGLPGRVSPVRGDVLRGRRIAIRYAPEFALIPGETVRVETTKLTLGSWIERTLSRK